MEPEPHIFRTANMGTTWTDISSNLPNAPIDAIAVDPIAHNVVYIGTDVGAYISFDAGQNWEVMGSGLPLVTIGDMKVHPTQHFLIAGTHGRSMYKIDLTDITGIGFDNGAPIAATFELHQNYPNPFNPTTKISYNLPGSGQVHLKIYNVMGQEVRTLVNESQIAGNYTAVWDGRDNHGNMVSSGVYIYRLSAGNDVQSRKMTLLR